VPVRLTDSSASSPPSPVAAPLPKPAAVEQDSLVLQKDRFSIVLATFYTKRVAREQLGLLKAKGIRAYLWEVSSGGSKFYRLATGNYSTHGSAHESLTSMPKPIAKGAYIQKAAKNVVMYGEKSQL
jgi:cell division septation protein DedD